MSLDGFFNRLKTKEHRDLNSQASEQAALLGSYLFPERTIGKAEPPPGLRTEFRKAEDLLNQGLDSGIESETHAHLREVVNRIRQSYRLY
jgi:hypothetical protein